MIYNQGKYNLTWETSKLADLGTFNRGVSKYRPRNAVELYDRGKYPFIQTGDVKKANLYIVSHEQAYNELGLKQSKMWNKDTLCITIAANIAETGILKYPMCFPDSIVGFVADKNKTSELFMYYIFEYIKQHIKNSASGSIQDNINIEFLTGLNFKIPKKEVQKEVAKTLSMLDEKIIANNKINDNLYQQLSTLYDYWFTQFDFPNEEGKPYRSSGGQMVYNEQLKREIPSGWEVKRVNDIAPVITGKEDANFSTKNGVYKFFTCSNESMQCDTPAFDGKAVLIAGNGDFNVKHFTGKFNAYQRTYVLIPFDSTLYASLYMVATSYIAQFKNSSNGSIVKFITKGDIEDMFILIPRDKTLLERLNNILKLIEENKLENEKLISLRDWLLPMLMNGQATISE